ncbi:fused CCA tRNA nucleotidyltransferase/phosphohydrolase [Gammaproteobacteria bacterium]
MFDEVSMLDIADTRSETTGLTIYLVGGAVRDELLGRPVAERDWVVVGTTPEELKRRGFRQVGKDFPVFLHPITKEEYALARTERKTARGYRGFVVHADPSVTLEDDLRRRDLTINALARAPDGTLVDLFGGLDDLRNGRLRHVSPAFAEDPVRILRVARFAARYDHWGFHIAHDTHALMRSMVEDGEVDALVPERVWAELVKALGEERPWCFFEVLRTVGALARLFPELDALWGVPQPAQYHAEIDTGIHAMLVLRQATRLSPAPVVRFAALTHDLGKAVTPQEEWPKHHGHEQRGVKPIKALCDRYKAPREYRELAVLVARWHSHCHNAAKLRSATLCDTLMALDGLRRRERFEQFLLACEADARGRLGKEDEPYPEADLFRNALTAAAAVPTAPLVAAGLTGEPFAATLRKQRIAAIRAVRSRIRHNDPSDYENTCHETPHRSKD